MVATSKSPLHLKLNEKIGRAVFAFDSKGVVETRELPSDDMAVWHPMSARLRDVAEPICRGRVHWKAEFNNWIVFRQFAGAVLADLETQGRRVA
jgi:hypothetical protein